ncbi:MAG TPA: ATP synthase F1 subunit gamma [Bacteroidetes bacterium]|nr:ATP synthase F1 subunit gamma [Bacteroidota bacterium]
MSGKLKEVRERIKSVNSTMQVTSAMKMVAAAKLKKAQDAIVQLRPYAFRLNKMLINILSNMEGDVNTTLGQERELKHAAIVVVTSNRGLCGAFNLNIIKQAEHLIHTEFKHLVKDGNLDVICIGKKGYEYFSKHHTDLNVSNEFVDAFNDLSYSHIAGISDKIMDAFKNEKYDMVKVAFARFKNAAIQYAETEQFLPVPKVEITESDIKQYKSNYIFEPDKDSLLETLIPSIMHTTFRRYLLDTNASEHGARMTAMENATENAKDMLGDLKLEFNKARQESITKELLEIISGATALEG